MLSAGLPRRHHVVVYQSIHLPHHTHQSLQAKLKLQVIEVGAAAWFDEDLVRVLASRDRSSSNEEVTVPPGLPESFRFVNPIMLSYNITFCNLKHTRTLKIPSLLFWNCVQLYNISKLFKI